MPGPEGLGVAPRAVGQAHSRVVSASRLAAVVTRAAPIALEPSGHRSTLLTAMFARPKVGRQLHCHEGVVVMKIPFVDIRY